MVRPCTSSTPPVITRPGSPQAWASTAVIMLENRNRNLLLMLHCCNAKSVADRALDRFANGRREEGDRSAGVFKGRAVLAGNSGGRNVVRRWAGGAGSQNARDSCGLRSGGEDYAG